MNDAERKCFNCDKKGKEFFGFVVCEKCKSKLRLYSENTVKGFLEKDPAGFPKEITRRLELLEKDYIKKKIKLLHVKSIIN